MMSSIAILPIPLPAPSTTAVFSSRRTKSRQSHNDHININNNNNNGSNNNNNNNKSQFRRKKESSSNNISDSDIGAQIWDAATFYPREEMISHSYVGQNFVVSDFPLLSVQRFRELQAIKSVFNQTAKSSKLRVPNQCFTRWVVDQNHEAGIDPLILEYPSFEQTKTEMKCSDEKFAPVALAVTAQCQNSFIACLRVLQDERPECISSGVRVQNCGNGFCEFEFHGVRHTINEKHLEKLQTLYRRHGQRSSDDKSGFNGAVFCLLSRYKALNDVGFQGALHEKVFDVLKEEFGVKMECFASPLNCRYGLYCSAFPDTDAAFGSLGSFFSFFPKSGSFEVNPPFTEPLLLRTAMHIEDVLERQNNSCGNDNDDDDGRSAVGTSVPLSFIVFVPCWEDCEGWLVMRRSRFLQRLVIIDHSDHGYVVGDQHSSKRRHLTATFNTGVFFLQNEAASVKWGPTDEKVTILKQAFASSAPRLSNDEKKYHNKTMKKKIVRDIKDDRTLTRAEFTLDKYQHEDEEEECNDNEG